MAQKKNDGGFQSSAGLMRYFDSETDKGIKITPRAVIGVAIALVAIVVVAQVFFPV
ncbi:MAG: preprotein translocase subunit Sec61beta [Candidatus Methanomethylophilaceae archaeon]|jgi:preprotein translocase subunit Sec61beta